MILTRLTRWALRTAARRWPADLREDLHREWLAELAHLERQPGRVAERLGFAVSLLTSPPARDATGVPRGWAEARSGMSPAAALMLAAVLGIGVVQTVRSLVQLAFDAAGVESPMWLHFEGWVVTGAVVLTLWCVPVAWWLGRRLPMSRDGRLGAAGPAVLAPLAVLPALLIGEVGEGPLVPHPTTVIGIVAWTVLTALAGAAAARSTREGATRWVLAGVPAVAALATALATVPVLITQGPDAAAASLLLSFDTGILKPDESGLIVHTGALAGTFLAYGWLAVLYGRRAATAPERPARLTDRAAATLIPHTAAPPASSAAPPASSAAPPASSAASGTATTDSAATAPPAFPPVVLVAGVVATLAGVLSWAYTVTYLTAAMPVMSAAAPMPGGDGELYLWVAELRWAAILFAALGLLVATANRRHASRAAAALAAGLLATESALLINEVTGLPGLRIALLAAAATITLAWTLAGRIVETPAGSGAAGRAGTAAGFGAAGHAGTAAGFGAAGHAGTAAGFGAAGHAGTAAGFGAAGHGGTAAGAGAAADITGTTAAARIRTRTMTAAIAAAGLGPLLLAQGTPAENHPFMPLGLPLTTILVAAGTVLLGVVTAAATSVHRLRPAVTALLVTVPPAVTAGFGVFLGNGAGDQVSIFGVFLSLPFAVTVAAVLRRHRARRRGRTAAIWTLLAVAGLPGALALFLAAIMPLSFAANLLFVVDGTGYPADGVSVLPGATLILLPAAIMLAARSGGAPNPLTPPAPGPLPDGPAPAAGAPLAPVR
ncbi:hypothetical protein [Actinoplanes subglobosus]|uniref:Integral membrane protein n=1 Tax=Actinoplanes subglobosus TaxID=1547892 RepID=A0ABV8IQK8_9ACTN